MAEQVAFGGKAPALSVDNLHVYYGHSHALQGVSFRLDEGILAVVGRNGMGKTTLCNAIIGLIPAARGSIQSRGRRVLGLPSHRIVGMGIGYVPQGRRVWPSLSVDEHLRLAAGSGRKGQWTVARIYDTFPRLAERRRNGGHQLSGGEQQMLAISRALLSNPYLLVMDEPTEGLAPVIVEQLEHLLRQLANDHEISVLLIEQNLGVATAVADRVAIMVNGHVARELPAEQLARDRELQQRLLGVRTGEDTDEDDLPPLEPPTQVFQVRRRAEASTGTPGAAPRGPTLWSQGNPLHRETSDAPARTPTHADTRAEPERLPSPAQVPVSALVGRSAYVVGTFDTKGRELGFMANRLRELGLKVVTVDLSTSRRPSPADIGPAEVARHHPRGMDAVFTNDRGSSVAGMALAFEHFIATRRDLGGIVSAGGSGGTALATPAMQRLPVGIPKFMVSTVASGNVQRYVGPADICMMYSVTDVAGINRISEQVLSNAAHALAGMIAHRRAAREEAKPAVGLTMFGVTTPCVQSVARALEVRFDCLVFHATGTGGQSMEKLVDSGLLAGVLDITTTEVCDLHMGGVMAATEDRFGAIIRSRIPYVGSCGALDMVNWGAMDTVPARFRGRNLYRHNPQVTLMRTTPEENVKLGQWIGERLNRMEGPVRLLIPEGGVSLLDKPGQPFHDPAADEALFEALSRTVHTTRTRKLVRLPYNINDPEFAHALVANFLEIIP